MLCFSESHARTRESDNLTPLLAQLLMPILKCLFSVITEPETLRHHTYNRRQRSRPEETRTGALCTHLKTQVQASSGRTQARTNAGSHKHAMFQ